MLDEWETAVADTAVFPPTIYRLVWWWETADGSWLGRNGCYSADARLRMTKQVAQRDAV
ncbi:MAG: hypothetical protein WAS33_09205 [Candidatus Promineifilaceae bacterium]